MSVSTRSKAFTSHSKRADSRTPKSGGRGLLKDEWLQLYYFMRLTRAFEETILKLYRQGKIVGGAYTGRGNEATSVGSAFCLRKEDYLFPMHRDMGAHLVKGQSLQNLMLQHLGRETSLTQGRDGTGHYADPALRIYGNISHLGAMIPVAAGVALACRLRKEKSVVMTYIGDGGSNVGDFHESLAMCSVMKLPLVLIIENNQYAYSTPVTKQVVAERLSDRAVGYGIPGYTIDGTDVGDVFTSCHQAIERARDGNGPTLIESVTMRMQGHSAADAAEYVPKSLIEKWKRNDPIAKLEEGLTIRKILTSKIKWEFGQRIDIALDDAMKLAIESSEPVPERVGEGIFA